MFCKRWTSQELIPKMDLLAFLLLLHPHITGVLLTGSLARKERKIHDIDLVVLHDGEMEDGSACDPMKEEPYYSNDLLLATTVSGGPEFLSRALGHARGPVPLNYIFVHEEVLWNCAYLQSLSEEERYSEFYKRVFCDIPLLLFDPYSRRGLLRERIEVNPKTVIAFGRGISGLAYSYPVVQARHQCENPECLPHQPWSECRKEIRRRKVHLGHLTSSLFGR